jgi:CRISPR-associated protein Cas1
MLSYLYSVLIKDIAVASFTVGLEPNLGLYHRTRYNRPALALDVAEEFRSIIVDSLVISLINRHEIKQEHFTNTGLGTILSKEVKKILLNGYERRKDIEIEHPFFGYKITYRRLIEVQMRLFAGWLLGEIPDYIPFEVR